MSPNQVKEAHELLDQLEHIERASRTITTERHSYQLKTDHGYANACEFPATGAELLAFVNNCIITRRARLRELGVEVPTP
jgi:hypothetical protein